MVRVRLLKLLIAPISEAFKRPLSVMHSATISSDVISEAAPNFRFLYYRLVYGPVCCATASHRKGSDNFLQQCALRERALQQVVLTSLHALWHASRSAKLKTLVHGGERMRTELYIELVREKQGKGAPLAIKNP